MMLVRATHSASRAACRSLPRSSTVAWQPAPLSFARLCTSTPFLSSRTKSDSAAPPANIQADFEKNKGAVNQQALISWVDAMEYEPDDLEKIPMELDQMLDKVLKLHVDENLRPEFEEALTEAGVKTVEDLQHVTENDLVKCGIAAVPARKFLLAIVPKPEVPALLPAIPASPTTTGLYDPVDTMKGLAKKGVKQGERCTEQVLASSFLGGSLLGFGCALTVTVAGGASPVLVAAPGLQQLIAGAIFPAGLSMVILSGSELLTGNFVTMALPYSTHPGKPRELITSHLAKGWALSGLGNLAGSLFLAGGIYSCSVVTAGTPAAAWLCALTAKKCGLPLMTMIGKAAGANWLVNVAIFQASSAHTTAGKIASLWIPIMTFVALGLEHSIANMFLLPLGWSLGADVTLAQIAGNIGPVLFGNALGAIAFVGGVQRYNLLKNLVHRSK
mmetsp:Transcript_39058/g.67812  ORF Transcript_39058/g.67812 Transcript_39058/m.67812 type:complete len:445 (-) Transcript_39058:207-1541(-)